MRDGMAHIKINELQNQLNKQEQALKMLVGILIMSFIFHGHYGREKLQELMKELDKC